jgi:hypothetical protein
METTMPGSSLWMPYAPQGVKGFYDDEDDCISYCTRVTF